MGKNYFTDEQVKALAKKSGIDISYLGYFHELKRLMNLAVETAIGESVLRIDPNEKFKVLGELIGGNQVVVNATTTKVNWGYHTQPLYSVKELEN